MFYPAIGVTNDGGEGVDIDTAVSTFCETAVTISIFRKTTKFVSKGLQSFAHKHVFTPPASAGGSLVAYTTEQEAEIIELAESFIGEKTSNVGSPVFCTELEENVLAA